MDKYLEGTCTEKEKELLDTVLDSYDDQGHSDLHLDRELDIKNEIYANIISKTGAGANRRNPQKANPKKWMNIAASILIVMGIGAAWYLSKVPNTSIGHKMITQTTEWGQRTTVNLSDGTMILLNSGSTIEFPDSFQTASVREVKLNGEAFFEVAENPEKPFVVKTENVRTTVLGTSFNVNSYAFNTAISVTVRTGRVRVKTSPENGVCMAMALGPNEKMEYNRKDGSFSKHFAENEDYMDWKNGIIRFDDIDLLEVSKTLSRWYGVHIVFVNESLQNCHLTARYENATLQVVLESIKYAIKGMDYEYKDENTILFLGNCTN